jgi:hypothetical protein
MVAGLLFAACLHNMHGKRAAAAAQPQAPPTPRCHWAEHEARAGQQAGARCCHTLNDGRVCIHAGVNTEAHMG